MLHIGGMGRGKTGNDVIASNLLPLPWYFCVAGKENCCLLRSSPCGIGVGGDTVTDGTSISSRSSSEPTSGVMTDENSGAMTDKTSGSGVCELQDLKKYE